MIIALKLLIFKTFTKTSSNTNLYKQTYSFITFFSVLSWAITLTSFRPFRGKSQVFRLILAPLWEMPVRNFLTSPVKGTSLKENLLSAWLKATITYMTLLCWTRWQHSAVHLGCLWSLTLAPFNLKIDKK